MKITNLNQIMIGNDPRKNKNYITLFRELSKLTHPARPDVDWTLVEKKLLVLFEENGLDLQSITWYTLARANTIGLMGMADGLNLLKTVVENYWESLWPSRLSVRMEAMLTLNRRMQMYFRHRNVQYDDLEILLQIQASIKALNLALMRYAQQLDVFEPLQKQIDNAISQIKKQSVSMELQSDTLSEHQKSHLPETSTSMPVQPIYIVKEQESGSISTGETLCSSNELDSSYPQTTQSHCKGIYLGLGMLIGGIVIGLGILGWQHYLSQKSTEVAILNQSLTPLPQVLSDIQTKQLAQLQSIQAAQQAWIPKITTQINQTAMLKPDWLQTYQLNLVEQSKQLWPDQNKIQQLANETQTRFTQTKLTNKQLNGWHQGMQTLESLSEKLNRLDHQKGQYITVSELKTLTFEMMTQFGQMTPAEEALRQFYQIPQTKPLPASKVVKLETHLTSLLNELAQLKQVHGQ